MEGKGENDVNLNKTEDKDQMGLGNNKKRSRKNKKQNIKDSVSFVDIEDKKHTNLVYQSETIMSNSEAQDSFNLKSNVPEGKQSNNDKNVDSSGKSKTSIRKRKHTLRDKKNNTAKDLQTNISKENDKINNCENYLGSLILNKINYDTQISTDDIDVNITYTSVPSAPEDNIQYSENPESKRKRIEIVSRQCRLHPSNEQYNQGPVLNPPLISPGIVVGYTPAGQRHEVDLNVERPTWFNSEYARKQFDDATRINVSRMMHELSLGQFLPDNLNPDLEKQYFKERALVREEATRHFENMKIIKEPFERELQKTGEQNNSCDKEHSFTLVKKTDKMQFLETERRLIELTECAIIKINDFPSELSRKICELLKEEMNPLMFLKNPIIVETFDKIARQRTYMDVNRWARAFNDRIKLLFDVPQSQTFQQYFQSEVKRLVEKTKDMSTFDVAVMTDESEILMVNTKCMDELKKQASENEAKEETKSEQTSSSNEAKEETKSEQTSASNETKETKSEQTSSSNEIEEEWVPVEEGDNWQDIANDSDLSTEWAQDMDDGDETAGEVLFEAEVIREVPYYHISGNLRDDGSDTNGNRDGLEDVAIENPEE